MVDTLMLSCIYLFFILAYCEGISEEYFLDNGEDATKDLSENISLPNTTRLSENVTLYSKPISNNDDDYKFSDSEKNIINSDIAVGERISGTVYTDTIDIAYEESFEKEPFVSKVNTILDVLKDYVYQYDEPAVHQALRDQNPESQFEIKSNVTAAVNITDQEEETSEKLLIDFYNLQPANPKLPKEDSAQGKKPYFDIQKYVNNSIWYVPENLPCWDLPILYGELGQAKKKEVFVTFSSKLKNVKEKYEEEKISHKKFNIPVSEMTNKWCAANPCYGDHTLCLFPDMINSKLCVSDYEVSTPTMIERTGLVNTVNSMRNRIATGAADLYTHLPTAADMKQMIYDFDLQTMAEAWLHQCTPGPSACSSLDGNYIAQLECTKYTEHCCIKSYKTEMGSKCIPQRECFIEPIVGCIHTWFRSAVNELTTTDVECGHITPNTFNTVQLIWAETNKIGCAYGKSPWGDIRVVCNFAPGAPFSIYTKSFCGFIHHKEMMDNFSENITDPDFLAHLGIFLHPVPYYLPDLEITNHDFNYSLRFSDIDILNKVYTREWVRTQINKYGNGTMGLIARLVTKYTFGEDSGPQCDTSRYIYESGKPGSMCLERGRRFNGLCYDFLDPTPGYRLVAVLAPIALFLLILYDLFSGVVRQTNY